MIGSYLACWGKVADLTTTAIGLSLGFTEMNPVALTPSAILLTLTIYPSALCVVELIAERHRVGWVRWLLVLPGVLAWVPVLNNVWWLLR
jgi:hypothetical protein